ncbi:MAG TPA: hypothetical protein VN764_13390, partial [Polyangiaceae bacterium]|nr:hypothetical protein [Polyangiaceae bacterium]
RLNGAARVRMAGAMPAPRRVKAELHFDQVSMLGEAGKAAFPTVDELASQRVLSCHSRAPAREQAPG